MPHQYHSLIRFVVVVLYQVHQWDAVSLSLLSFSRSYTTAGGKHMFIDLYSLCTPYVSYYLHRGRQRRSLHHSTPPGTPLRFRHPPKHVDTGKDVQERSLFQTVRTVGAIPLSPRKPINERRACSHLRAAAHAPLGRAGLPFDGFVPRWYHVHFANARTVLLADWHEHGHSMVASQLRGMSSTENFAADGSLALHSKAFTSGTQCHRVKLGTHHS